MALTAQVNISHELKALPKYRSRVRPALRKAGKRALRMIGRKAAFGYMQPGASGTAMLGVVTGRLREILLSTANDRRSQNVVFVSRDGIKLRKGVRDRSRGVHELGWSGEQHVKEHTRAGRVIQAHTRYMVIPARPYLAPAVADALPIIQKDLGLTLNVVVESSYAGSD